MSLRLRHTRSLLLSAPIRVARLAGAPLSGALLARVLFASALLAVPASVVAQDGADAGAAAEGDPVDYTDPSSWLCRPGRDDACAVNQTATAILADGTMLTDAWHEDPDAPIDCFYVYPTVSQAPSANSPIEAGPGETGVVAAQLARFASECRLFAPLYRQITLAALRAGFAGNAGNAMAPDREMAYDDVLDAWNDYLARDNEGRGVVLIGHSQGSSVLTRLIQEEIDGQPIQSRVVSALLLGWNTLVPEGRDVGGAFEEMPLCRSRTQVGCIVTYVSFPEDMPPPANSLFGRTQEPGMTVACTNPAALGGGRAELESYLSSPREGLPPWVTPERPVRTRFVKLPGLVFGECVSNENGSYLAVSVDEGRQGRAAGAEAGAEAVGPRSERTTNIGGHVRNPDGSPNRMWGLHLIDVHLTMGDLVELVGDQAEAYLEGAESSAP